ncbi:MAG TPA: amidohydrolase family protein, partial [Methylomirabilota bacterium]|nr:amidohydrolase family protein [Methylomirabilota bacterium]
AALALYSVPCLLAAALAVPHRERSAPQRSGSAGVAVYRNARIYTNDPAHPWAESLAVRGDAIVAVGTSEEVARAAGPGAAIEDLRGAFVMPGFNDAHTHLGSAGLNMLSVPVSGVGSVEELQERIRKAAAEHKPGEWLVGKGWDQTRWPEKKFPTRQQMDAAAPKNPVFLRVVSGHVAIANTLALELAGISKATPNPSGGEIERDASGEPTGMLKEGPAMALVAKKIPPPTPEQRRKGIELVLADLASNGVTSAQDNSSWEDFLIYRALKNDGKLTARITEWLPFAAPLEKLEEMRRDGGTTDPMLRTGALKFVTDGALGTRTAAMLAPYSDAPDTTGILILEPERLRALAIERDKAGFQIAFHAIGDRANRVALDVFEAVRQANGPRDRRDRIEHAQIVAPEDLPRFARLGVIASMQPSHQTTDMRWAEQRIGPGRVKGAYAWATLEKSGAPLAFGTDYDVEPISPFRGLYACVTRELPEGGPPGGWQPQEKISLEDCVRAYTSGSAYAEFSEGKKGELKAGESADFIVLSDDLTKIPPSQYTKVRVLRTVVAGRTVYQAK